MRRMELIKTWWSVLSGAAARLGLILLMGASMSACGDRWKEEVLLHDGSKIIVERSQSFGGSRELGQSPPIKEQDITFVIPHTGKTISFKSEYGEDIGRANFILLALHILKGTPYIIAKPNLCLSYNKWGRPNPPYVFFKYDGNAWQRISLQELPIEFKEINLVIDTKTNAKTITTQSLVPADLVIRINGTLPQPEFKTILRAPVKNGDGLTTCEEWVRIPGGGWQSPGGAKAPVPITPGNKSNAEK